MAIAVILDVPGGTLATQEERHDAEEAIREAFAEIERQLIRHKDRLANSDVYKRRERRENLRRKKVEAIPTVERRHELFSALLEQHLQALYNFTRREIAYRVAIDDLLPDEVTADDVVALRARCGQDTYLVTASRASDAEGSDALRLSRPIGRRLIESPSPFIVPGTLTALWATPDPTVVTVVTHNVNAGRYDAFQASLSCAR